MFFFKVEAMMVYRDTNMARYSNLFSNWSDRPRSDQLYFLRSFFAKWVIELN